MKAYLIIFILVLCFTCWLGDSGGPPTVVPIGIGEIEEAAEGQNQQDVSYGDFSLSGEARKTGFATKIDEKTIGENVAFPWGSAR